MDQSGQPQSETGSRSQPWLLHSLPVNALNFCPFSLVFLDGDTAAPATSSGAGTGDEEQNESPAQTNRESPRPRPVLVAVPNALNSGAVDFFHIPLEKRVSTIPAPDEQTGMVMAVDVFFNPHSSNALYVCSAYEDGHVMVFACRGRDPNSPGFQGLEAQISSSGSNNTPWKWEKLYSSLPHSQPVLGIDVSLSQNSFLSSSADAVLGMHPIPPLPASIHTRAVPAEQSPLKTVHTKHAGQQGVRIRSDGKIFATAGWDSRVRVYSYKTMKELAVLKWHKDGCFAVSFAETFDSGRDDDNDDSGKIGQRNGSNTTDVLRQENSLAVLQQQRHRKVQKTHWLAAGSKDAKISLWDIY